MPLPAPLFDIFQGHYSGKNAIWVSAARGLAAARERMAQIAANKPGPYFVFSSREQLVLAILDTTPPQLLRDG